MITTTFVFGLALFFSIITLFIELEAIVEYKLSKVITVRIIFILITVTLWSWLFYLLH